MTSTIAQEARAVWRGELTGGVGTFRSGTVGGQYSFAARFEGEPGSTPEELLAAAQAASFSMALARFLGKHGLVAAEIRTMATVHLHTERFAIAYLELATEASVPGVSAPEFIRIARLAKENCPVAKAFGAVPVVLRSAVLTAARARADE